MALVAAGQRPEAIDRLFGALSALGERGDEAAGDWAAYNERLARRASHSTVTATSDARLRWWVGITLAIVVTVALGYWTFRRIVVPLRSMETSVKAIAAGDYAQEVPFTKVTDEIGCLARSVAVLKQSGEAMVEHRWLS